MFEIEQTQDGFGAAVLSSENLSVLHVSGLLANDHARSPSREA